MTRGFPNLFVMPAPAQQAVVTVNYTQLAVLGAELVGRTVGLLDRRGVAVFDVRADAEDAWVQKILDSFIDASSVMAACTPSRINHEGDPGSVNPRSGNYGRGLGDYFAYRALLEDWLDRGDCEGLELDEPVGAP
jgi:cyclohexanone monooxygenase/pentalenolactone D synthase